MKALNKILLFGVSAFASAAVLGAASVGWLYSFQQRDAIAPGVTVEGVKLNGLSRGQANELLQKIVKKKTNLNAVLLDYEKKSWRVSPAEIDLRATPEKTVAAAYAIGRSGNIIKDLQDTADCFINGKKLIINATCNEKKLTAILDKIAKTIDCPGTDATCDLINGSIVKRAAVTGKRTDTKALTAHLVPSIAELRLPRRIEIEPDLEKPAVTDDDLKAVDRVLGSYTTYFDPSIPRGENIALAAEAIHRQLIKPGETFSFNKVVGLRTAAAGYKNAPVIIDGRTEDGIGGGVCQVSSTLYNAILLANLTPTDRSNHYFPSSYVPEGLDATVADGAIDFCFKNNLKHNVYLLASISGGALTIDVLGTHADLDGLSVEIDTSVGEKGVVHSWRTLYDSQGREIRREHLYTDEYQPPKPPLDQEKKKQAASQQAANKPAAPKPPVPAPPTAQQKPAVNPPPAPATGKPAIPRHKRPEPEGLKTAKPPVF